MSKLRFQISMSLDGFVAGPSQSVDDPIGVGGMRLHQWVFPLRVWRAMQGLDGGEDNESARIVEESFANIGATVMGRNMFGGHPGPWKNDEPWNVDEMEIHQVPTLLGSGERLFDGVGDDLRGLELVRTVAMADVTHFKYERR